MLGPGLMANYKEGTNLGGACLVLNPLIIIYNNNNNNNYYYYLPRWQQGCIAQFKPPVWMSGWRIFFWQTLLSR